MAVGGRDDAEQRPQDQAAGDDQAHQRPHREAQLHQRAVALGASLRGQQRDGSQGGDGGQVLEEQDAERGLPVLGGQLALLGQQLHHERGGRQREADAHDDRRRRCEPQRHGHPGEHQCPIDCRFQTIGAALDRG